MNGRRPFPGITLFALAAGGAFSACSVGPNYQGPPADPVPPRFKNAGAGGGDGRWKVAEPKDGAARGPWWRVFRDPALDALETGALANNQDLRVASARIAEARALTRVAAADFYPNAQAEPSAVRQRTSNTDPFQRGRILGSTPFGGTGGDTASSAPTILANQPLSRTSNLFRAPVDLNWELDLFGRVRRNTEAARADRAAAEADFQNVTLSLSANVAVNFFTLRALDTELAVLERTLRTRREALRIATERLEAGLTGELDVTRARADLATNEADVFALLRTRAQVENALATLVGQPASTLRLARRPLEAGSAPPRVPAGLPSRLLERRPDVAVAERQLAAANARIGVATAAFFPQIRLTGAAGFESADIGDLFLWQSRIWQIGPSVTLPIFQGGRNVANLQAARARFDEGVGRYRQQVLVAFQETENALSDLRTLAGQAEAQGRAVAAARRTVELAEQQYGKGAISFLDVLDAQRTLLQSERVSAQLLGQRLQATVQLIKALGGDWL